MTATRLPRSVWIPVLGLALVIFGWRLSSVPLTNWDEGIYANVNLELFQSRDWTKLTYFGADFLEKPPLQFWLTYPLFGILGPTELAVRAWSAVAGVGTALLIALWCWQAVGRRSVALLAPTFFILGRFALIHAFRTGDLDGLLTFFITLGLYGYWRSWTAPRWFVVFGAATAAAIMTKSFVGVVPLIVVGLDLLLTRGWRRIGWSNIAWGIGALLVLAAPWHIVEAQRFGRAFWDSYLGTHVIERTTESLFTRTPWYFYLQVIRDRFFPFSFLLPLAVVVWSWHRRDFPSGLGRVLLNWAAVVLAVFTAIQTRREWYILPLYPAAAMLLAFAGDHWWRTRTTSWVRWAFILSIAAAAGHLLTDTHLRSALAHVPVVDVLTRPFWRTIPGQALFGAAIGSLVLLCAHLFRRRGGWWRWALGVSGTAGLAVALGWSVLYIRALPSSLPLKTIGARVAQEKVQQMSLIGTRLKKQPAGYFYLLRLDTHSTEEPVGTLPTTPLVVTTTEPKNAPLNTGRKVISAAGDFLLIDLR